MQDSNLLFYDQKASQAPPDTKPTGWVFDPDLKGLSFAMLLCFLNTFYDNSPTIHSKKMHKNLASDVNGWEGRMLTRLVWQHCVRMLYCW